MITKVITEGELRKPGNCQGNEVRKGGKKRVALDVKEDI